MRASITVAGVLMAVGMLIRLFEELIGVYVRHKTRVSDVVWT